MWEGEGERVSLWEVGFKNSIENSVGEYYMVIILVFVRSSFYINMEAFYCIEMKALLLAL